MGGGGGGGVRKLADTAGKGPACRLPCLSSGAFSCLSDTAEKGPAVSTATLQKS